MAELNERYRIFLNAYPNEPRPGDKKWKNHLPYMEWIGKKKRIYLNYHGNKTDSIIDQNDFTEFLKNNPR